MNAKESPATATIYSLIHARVLHSPQSTAIEAPGRVPLSYRALWAQLEYTVQTLNQLGFGVDDRVAILLPHDPELAVACLAVAAGATAAPLNPAYSARELEAHLAAYRAGGLVVHAGYSGPAIDIARTNGVRILELWPRPESAAGEFGLTGERQTVAARTGFAQADDVALLLSTSGTTARPRIVPLTHANIRASVCNLSTAHLIPADRCLNLAPLFHVGGLHALIASLIAGSCAICAPYFEPAAFFEWLERLHPTWYHGPPSMHRAILDHVATHPGIVKRHSLRFIRSGAAHLPPKLMAALEDHFGVPVIDGYGCTETASRISVNPFPPAKRKPGSVGVPSGPEVAIMDSAGGTLGPGKVGEIVARGDNVISGYDNDSEASVNAFRNGWFRTGDLGYLDDEGYLYITGRLKEIINRGGEVISPWEIDSVLMEHPAVAEAVAFALPHERLGEAVGAAVVLREGASVSDLHLRKFASMRLAPYKVPLRIVIVDRVPKGPTGKPQRIGLAEKLGLLAVAQSQRGDGVALIAPRNEIEETIAGIWARVLDLDEVGVEDDFFELGGDSILAAQIVSRVREALQVELSLTTFFDEGTIAGLAAVVEHILSVQETKKGGYRPL